MKFTSRFVAIVGAILLFILCLYVGINLTQSTSKLLTFVSGINNWEYQIQEQTVVYASNGTELGKLGNKKEYSEDFPEFMKKALVAVEDKRFYQHNGLDSKGIVRAIYTNLRSGSKSEGGSTITQQLARTLFLSTEKSYSRKIKEVFIARAIESKYTKASILNIYLNEIYTGRGCSGMASAAESYFGKNVADLNKAEITMLVGIIQAPEYYSPDRNMPALKQRQAVVIKLLVEQEIISSNEGQTILAEKLNIQPYRQNMSEHPYYMAYLSKQLEDIIGAKALYHGGLKIYTTVDSRMQNAAEVSVKNNHASFSRRGITAKDVALVSIDPQTGGIKAMVGGVDWEKNQLNMAVLPRQPGSAIKPLYYAAAMDEGLISPDDPKLNNITRNFGDGYSPENLASSPSEVTPREALVHSYNVASVEVLNKLGPNTAISYLKSYGVSSIEKGDANLALGLGGMTRGISPLEMASAYCIFPAGGRHQEAYTVEKVVDSSDKIIYQGKAGFMKVIDASTAKQMDGILKDVVSYGTGTSAKIAIASGGKTGTTTDSRDLWYMGYTSELVTAVWTGNSDGAPIKGYGLGGGSVSGPVWRDYMNSLINDNVLKERASAKERVQKNKPAKGTPRDHGKSGKQRSHKSSF
jgi:penicillin-binding protein 1A